jgi:hypothetical protein
MTWIGTGTDVPVNAFVRCPRCRVSRMMVGQADDLFFVCGGCEWPMLMGAGGSPLTTSALLTQGATALPFASGGTQFTVGQLLFISDTTLSETVQAVAPITGTSVGITPTANAHATAKAVSVAVAAPALPGQEANPNTTN